MVKLIGQKAMNLVVSHLDEVRDRVWDEAKDVKRRAERNLASVRASTPHHKIVGPDGLTEITADKHDVDSSVTMSVTNTGRGSGNAAMHLEFGHRPSGVFEGTDTKAPEGLYILTQASGLGG